MSSLSPFLPFPRRLALWQAYSTVQPTNLAREKEKFLEQAAEYEAGRRHTPPEDPTFEYAGRRDAA
jgi:hypothetical protein